MAATPSQIATKVQGLREAKAAFQALEPTFRENLADATETTVQEGARHAKNRLESSPSIETRGLINAVGWTMNRNNGRGRFGILSVTTTIKVGGKRVRVKGIVKAGKGGSALTSAGATVDYPARRAHFVEFGTKNMKAEPFMIPAAESQEAPYLSRSMAAGRKSEQQLASGRFA